MLSFPKVQNKCATFHIKYWTELIFSVFNSDECDLLKSTIFWYGVASSFLSFSHICYMLSFTLICGIEVFKRITNSFSRIFRKVFISQVGIFFFILFKYYLPSKAILYLKIPSVYKSVITSILKVFESLSFLFWGYLSTQMNV